MNSTIGISGISIFSTPSVQNICCLLPIWWICRYWRNAHGVVHAVCLRRWTQSRWKMFKWQVGGWRKPDRNANHISLHENCDREQNPENCDWDGPPGVNSKATVLNRMLETNICCIDRELSYCSDQFLQSAETNNFQSSEHHWLSVDQWWRKGCPEIPEEVH